ncbi:MAG: hypothetical protein JW849_01730 [Phycisphaerae bacterium]|nr:hypothetical protein [Phycisphaerae bacterium]
MKTRTSQNASAGKGTAKTSPSSPPPKPVNVVDGVPDAAEKPSRWRLPLVLAIFAGWAAFLIYCLLAARV